MVGARPAAWSPRGSGRWRRRRSACRRAADQPPSSCWASRTASTRSATRSGSAPSRSRPQSFEQRSSWFLMGASASQSRALHDRGLGRLEPVGRGERPQALGGQRGARQRRLLHRGPTRRRSPMSVGPLGLEQEGDHRFGHFVGLAASQLERPEAIADRHRPAADSLALSHHLDPLAERSRVNSAWSWSSPASMATPRAGLDHRQHGQRLVMAREAVRWFG